ncbi:hypothetical protein [Parapedobacter composti]|nr:hypothetical protein [Parapedobacter composti]
MIQRIECFLCRDFLGIRDYKTKINFDASKQGLETALEQVQAADYALIIRPDVYPISFIKTLRGKTRKLIAYQWDGLSRFPRVYDYISLFDRFFVFDGNDLTVPSVLPITNYYPLTLGEDLYDEKLQSDVFYAGSYSKSRIDKLGQIILDFRSFGLDTKYMLYHRKARYLPSYDLRTTNSPIDYGLNIRYTYNTKIVLDLVNPDHDGLSFRFFEAMRFDKKVVTTNPRVTGYDFYHPDNIFVWDENRNPNEFYDFVQRPQVPLSSEIKEKYSFRNWLQYALDEGEYARLSIPC